MENLFKYHLKLYKFIENEETADNVMEIYKSLKGKENLEKRLFLKTLVYASAYPNNKLLVTWAWESPNRFFMRENNPYTPRGFTKEYLEHLFSAFKNYKGIGLTLYGHNLKNIFGYLI